MSFRQSINLSINSSLIEGSRKYEIDLSELLEQALIDALKEKKHLEWVDQNREALEAYNERIEQRGVFSDGLRAFNALVTEICRPAASTQSIDCRDHSTRSIVFTLAADNGKASGKKAKPTKADVALSKIGKLHRIERKIADWSDEKYWSLIRRRATCMDIPMMYLLECNYKIVINGLHVSPI